MALSTRAKQGLRYVYDHMPERVQSALAPTRHKVELLLQLRRSNQEVDRTAARIHTLAAAHTGERLFVDCGFNTGNTIRRFADDLPDFRFYGFELNGEFRPAAEALKAERPGQILSLDFAAVSDKQGLSQFWVGGRPDSANPFDGSTIMEDKITGVPDHTMPHVAPTIDFAAWVRQAVRRHMAGDDFPFLAVKMDIEGAEVPVLEHMIKDGAIHYLDMLVVEFHARCMREDKKAETKRREDDIIRYIRNETDVALELWI